MKPRITQLALFCLLAPSLLYADFRYEETTKITGGSLVGALKMVGVFSKDTRHITDPVTSMVLIKGNRMARITPDATEIVDLDKETMTHIDHANRQYTVVTFQQLKQQMEEAARKAKQQPKEQSGSADQPQMTFKVNVRNTGVAKQFGNVNAKEAILTMALEGKDKQTGQTGAMAITNDMWLAPEVPGYGEVREFYKRMAIKLGTVFGSGFNASMAAMQPGMTKGMGELAKEVSKLQGVPVFQVMRIGTSANGEPLPAASEAPLPPQPEGPSAGQVLGDVAQQNAQNNADRELSRATGGRLGGLAGALGGFGRKKKKAEDDQKAAEQKAEQQKAAQSGAAGVLMESESQMTGFSSAPIEAAKFEVPAGYKLVERKQ